MAKKQFEKKMVNGRKCEFLHGFSDLFQYFEKQIFEEKKLPLYVTFKVYVLARYGVC